jgi:hypothetical protein
MFGREVIQIWKRSIYFQLKTSVSLKVIGNSRGVSRSRLTGQAPGFDARVSPSTTRYVRERQLISRCYEIS